MAKAEAVVTITCDGCGTTEAVPADANQVMTNGTIAKISFVQAAYRIEKNTPMGTTQFDLCKECSDKIPGYKRKVY